MADGRYQNAWRTPSSKPCDFSSFFGIVKPMAVVAARRAAGQTSADEEPVPSDEVVLLSEIRDLLSQRA